MTDHFNGKNFINPTLSEQISPGISDVVGMMREGRQTWPTNLPTTGVPQLAADLGRDRMAVTFVNHATFLIQMPGITILTDPVWSERASPVSCFGPKRVRSPGIALEKIPSLDVVLVSHNHYDHLDLTTLRRLHERFEPTFVVPLGNRALLESAGIKDVVELDWWQSVAAPSQVQIMLTPTQHSSGRGLFDRDKALWGSYFVKRGDRSLFFGGDGGYSSHFSDIRERLGPPEVALLGIGSYEPSWFMRPLHMNPAEALVAHGDLEAGQSIGMHIGTFQLSSEAFDQPLTDLLSALRVSNSPPNSFTVMEEGETRFFPQISE
ncbi:MBL fold metallo-hydrolase [Thioclava sp. L04-15]|uniref:MBL fold metallo-hydrolase n=1 Tax=Thioclava sp. L04-15 TaxID=1915318 RepID=UPI000996560D|nr:MBL fold metallo-hydrolase [Thioclava sp. L04-15]